MICAYSWAREFARIFFLAGLGLSVAACNGESSPSFRAALPITGEMVYELN